MESYNPWWTNDPDPGYLKWNRQPVKWVPEIIGDISLRPFSLHFLTGPRQVGKTTALKIMINGMLEKRDPKSIFYYSCDELSDHKELGEVLDNYLVSRDMWDISDSVILLDEITFVDQWWRAVKSRIDRGVFEKDLVIITGSISLDILKQKERFPGRRGNGSDHMLYPLDFPSYCRSIGDLDIKKGSMEDLEKNVSANRLYSDKLKGLLDQYLTTGGFPLAIQDQSQYGRVSMETERTYLDWMKGDWNRAGKSDRYMKEVLSYIGRAKGTPVSWTSISTETSINSPHTARSYVEILEGMYSLLVLHNIRPDGRIDHKKNKKLHLTDPFLMRLVSNYTGSEFSMEWALEAVVASHLARKYDTYYWRGKTKCDVVSLSHGEQTGFEITKGIKAWKPPWHLNRSFLLYRDNIHLYLSSLG